jgi:hypothetical protein
MRGSALALLAVLVAVSAAACSGGASSSTPTPLSAQQQTYVTVRKTSWAEEGPPPPGTPVPLAQIPYWWMADVFLREPTASMRKQAKIDVDTAIKHYLRPGTKAQQTLLADLEQYNGTGGKDLQHRLVWVIVFAAPCCPGLGSATPPVRLNEGVFMIDAITGQIAYTDNF